ncbi:hypothetical protein CJJ23_04370 [Mycoplasmopsis agassizii]|uniref:Uncharacterized protein n=1 Tax=Mycoplasmopsis agassizii TaxID=33922 RepID=A0A269THQ8_9BACT|nr:DEAD/DEAH box helicase [Mycoplasmopsis agassizii]PAK21012.1 hypothetical protein CJJ23_04370 [Mycoplasmopsis agassizii]
MEIIKKDELLEILNTKNLTKEKLDRYRIILDNLLDISPNDPSITTTINDKTYFDLSKKLDAKSLLKIINNENFSIRLDINEFQQIIEELKLASTVEEVLEISKKHSLEISSNKFKELSVDFKKTLEKIIDNVESQSQKSLVNWKVFLNEATSINSENNIWPMHIGFLFVSVNIDGKSIFAPLFLKEVTIQIANSVATLKSNGELKVNEKLLWLLNNSSFALSVDFPFATDSIGAFINKVSTVWQNIYNVNIDLLAEIQKPENNTSEKITFHNGMILGLYQPLGGYARNRMVEIIKRNDIDNIFKVEFNKNINREIVTNSIFKKNFGFYRIVATNYSQDKAVVSALNQDTIIWGPPGTGKSQTIVNILANILAYEKTALVVSEKKAALEVIKNRIAKLSKFGLFILNDKNMKKSHFYEPIKEYVEFLENFNGSQTYEPTAIMSDDVKEYVRLLRELLQYEKHNELFFLIAKLKEYQARIDLKLLSDINALDENQRYPMKLFDDNFEKEFLKLNHSNIILSKLNLTEKQKKLNNLISFLKENFPNFSGDLNYLIPLVKSHDFKWFEHLILIENLNTKIDSFTYTDDILENMIAAKIASKIESLDHESDIYKKYHAFSSAAKLGNMVPHKFIKEHLEIIKLLFPIIITTPDTDLSGWEKNEFDYAIVDEASQIFIEKGLPILYLAKTKILAGDDKQMKPTRWFSVRSNDESAFGNVDSLLDYALSYGVHTILLNKNYRSRSAALMTFSSKHFYKSQLDVIDDFEVIGKKSIDVLEVNGKWEDGVNTVEIESVLELTVENHEKYEKIIILAFNTKQLNEITNRIFSSYPQLEKKLNDDQLLLRNIENIQGDEADLIIATLVYDATSKVHSTYVGRPGGANALNVAISRAREKMIVVKTIKADDLNNVQNNEDVSLFKVWLKFLELSSEEKKNYLQTSLDENKDLKHIKKSAYEFGQRFPELNTKLNFSLGTLTADLALFNASDKLDRMIMFDDFDYALPGSTYEDYIIFQDKINFLRAKKYPVEIITPLVNLNRWKEDFTHTAHKIIEVTSDNLHKLNEVKITEEEILSSGEKDLIE